MPEPEGTTLDGQAAGAAFLGIRHACLCGGGPQALFQELQVARQLAGIDDSTSCQCWGGFQLHTRRRIRRPALGLYNGMAVSVEPHVLAFPVLMDSTTLFVTGTHRSGTTLIEKLLGQ